MLELGSREHHLLSGIGVQILIVALLVFAYTQAVRQLKHRGELRDRLEEQLTVARDQLTRQGRRPDLAALQTQVNELKSALISYQALQELGRRVEELGWALGVQELQVKMSERPMQTIIVPLDGRLDFEVQLYALELSGVASSRIAAALVAAMGDPSSKLLAPLVGMELKQFAGKEATPARFSMRWLLAVSPLSAGTTSSPEIKPSDRISWGWREEPFLSPLEHPEALRIPASKTASFHLSEIVQGENGPACVLNGVAVGLNDTLSGYQVVLITSREVILQHNGEEILLRLP